MSQLQQSHPALNHASGVFLKHLVILSKRLASETRPKEKKHQAPHSFHLCMRCTTMLCALNPALGSRLFIWRLPTCTSKQDLFTKFITTRRCIDSLALKGASRFYMFLPGKVIEASPESEILFAAWPTGAWLVQPSPLPTGKSVASSLAGLPAWNGAKLHPSPQLHPQATRLLCSEFALTFLKANHVPQETHLDTPIDRTKKLVTESGLRTASLFPLQPGVHLQCPPEMGKSVPLTASDLFPSILSTLVRSCI